MSFREIFMIEIQEVLRRWRAGHSLRLIAKEACLDRKTVRRYVEAARSLGFDATTDINDELASRVAHATRRSRVSEHTPQWKALLLHRSRIETWRTQSAPLSITRIQELLARDGVAVRYGMLRRFVIDELGEGSPRSTIVVSDPPPASEAQVDFGAMGYLMVDGKQRTLWALIVVLSLSRHMFVWPTLRQRVSDVCEGLDAAWRFFGGVVLRIVPDNMKSIVLKADDQAPTLHPAFMEYAQARGFFVDPARVRRPQDKARVERSVPYVRTRCFQQEQLTSELDARAHAERWCRDVAGERVHGTTKRAPREHYESVEKAHMLPAPVTRFDTPEFVTVTVGPDQHARVANALYSLPSAMIGREVRARVDSNTVKFFDGTKTLKVYPRIEAGMRSTDPAHFDVERLTYASRSTQAMIERARSQHEAIGAFMEQLLEGDVAWMKMRQAHALLRLCERFGSERVRHCCERALSFEVFDVPRIEKMLLSAQKLEDEGVASGAVQRLPSGRFSRSPESFATTRVDRERGGQR